MTYAPRALLEARAEIRAFTGLTAVATGIAGDAAHVGGYHQGWDKRRTVSGRLADYAWTESPRDSSHRTDAASALDIGAFTARLAGHTITLLEFNAWLIAQCKAGTADTADIREVIYTPDGRTVKRWDRLGRRTTGDTSHLTHTHISYFRDAEHRDKAGLFRRFVAEMTGARTEPTRGGLVAVEDTITWEIRPWTEATLQTVRRLEAAAAADETRDKATFAAITALGQAITAGGGSVDAAAVIAAIRQEAETSRTAVLALSAELASARQEIARMAAELDQRNDAAAAAARATAEILADQ